LQLLIAALAAGSNPSSVFAFFREEILF